MPVILCRCGRSLGDIYPAYKALRLKKIANFCNKNANEIPATKIKSSVSEFKIDMIDELHSLGITLQCCITVLTTQTTASELI